LTAAPAKSLEVDRFRCIGGFQSIMKGGSRGISRWRVTHTRQSGRATLKNRSTPISSQTIERLQRIRANQRPALNKNRITLAMRRAGRTQDRRDIRCALGARVNAMRGERRL
jgi:hypothetical protein